MSKLAISSGQISLSDLRTHFNDTDSISMSDFRSGGNKVVSGAEAYSYTGSKYVNTASENTYWRVKTTQRATGEDGSGTITTTVQVFVHVGEPNVLGEQGTLADFTPERENMTTSYLVDTASFGNAQYRAKYPIGNPQGYITRGSLVSAGSYSAWQNNYGFKDIFENSTREKNDLYYIVFYEPNSRIQVTSNINDGVPQSGSIGFDDLYQIDNGIIWSGTINSGDGQNSSEGRGYRLDRNVPFGSVVGSAAVPDIPDVLQGQVPNGMSLYTAYQRYDNPSTLPFRVDIQGQLRTTAAGTISNTSDTNISRQRFGSAFNHTGYIYTNTTAVWTRPDELDRYNNYYRRNTNWSSVAGNETRVDDGRSGWLLPTQGPTLLQVRGEKETTSPFLANVRFTPNSFWRGRIVAIQALRTRQKGGITGFSCSGAASGDFSNLSNTDGGPITRYVRLPSSGYISLSAAGFGPYTGTNRIIQITIFDPFQWGMAKDRLVIRQVYINGTLVGDVTTDDYNIVNDTGTEGSPTHRNGVNFLNTGFTLPSSGTFTLELRR